MRRFLVIIAFVALTAARADAQAASLDSISGSLKQLFTAMQNKDTSAVRASFVANAKVLPGSALTGDATTPALSVDQFVDSVRRP